MFFETVSASSADPTFYNCEVLCSLYGFDIFLQSHQYRNKLSVVSYIFGLTWIITPNMLCRDINITANGHSSVVARTPYLQENYLKYVQANA